MDLREEILKRYTKSQRDKIVDWVGSSQQRFDELFKLFLNDEYRVVQRSSWPLAHCAEAHPELIRKNFGKLLKNLQKPNLSDAVKRNSVRMLQYVEIPEKYDGEVMSICFGYLESPDEPVAIKAFSLTVLGRLARQYPEIVPEIKLLVEDQVQHQTPAFRARANFFLKQVE
jgi:hypothetical protein